MIDLQPCAACDRHVASTETACPFCGAALSPAPPRPAARRLSRAALFASATLATAAACGGPKAKPDPDPMKAVPTADAGVDGASVIPPGHDPAKDKIEHLAPPDMPYGAPPARRRLV